MTYLFNRIAEVTISGDVASLDTTFSGLRVAFEIGKTSESAPNPAKITIYNLSAESRARLEKPGMKVRLRVGYAGIDQGEPKLTQIFVGDISPRSGVRTKREGPDIVTTIEAGDAEVAITTTTVDESFSGPTTPAQVIDKVVGAMGVTVGQIVPTITGLFQNGLTISGSASKHLDNITKQAGLEWHVTDGELNILDPKVPTLEPVVEVNIDTGLVGYPSKADGKGGAGEGSVVFTSLINPELKPGRAVLLTSDVFKGTFRIGKVHFKGDTHGQDWLATVEAS